ncbi:rRNA maturation RNase YbeY [Ruficoccus amylovorans]|uniref:Endoribonuclease YbeY n=1 Tax=Ruficoccus amylovorans TaxID=1804625 RepID=A0A842HCU2_9BACT|nr:rRNA maturation RNase YbeY [Ruficoccus amylovorans]MBC2594232.1 rRNA maturation RNase YbeY [Ruficoccus amylovorans]
MPRQIQLSQPSSELLTYDEEAVAGLFHRLDQWPAHRVPDGEISVAFLEHTAMAEVHGQFLDDATPTDVITFDGDPEMDFGGEICVGAEQAMETGPEHGNTLSQELSLYLVHGWLHLAGLDDRNEADRAQMRLAESQALAYLESTGGLPEFRPIL